MSKRAGRKVVPVPTAPGVRTRTLEFDRKSLIVYKKPRKMGVDAFSDFLDRAAQDILARYGMSKIVVGVSSWDELRIFDDEQLDELGLVRKEDVYLMKRDVAGHMLRAISSTLGEQAAREDEEE